MSASREKIVEMLGHNLRPAQVALACGISESYVSQLLLEPGVEEQVLALRSANAIKHVEHDTTLDDAEDMALKKVVDFLPMVTRSVDALRIFSVLNAAKRRAGVNVGEAPDQSTLVTIDLPETVRVSVKLTTDRQVIEVDGRSMLPMQARNVQKLLETRKTQRLLDSSIADVPLRIETPSLLDQI